MRIAVAYDGGKVAGTFEDTKEFKLYDAENGTIVRELLMNAGGEGSVALAMFLKAARVSEVICGTVGGPARAALMSAGIVYCPGVSGPADEAARKLMRGELDFDAS